MRMNTLLTMALLILIWGGVARGADLSGDCTIQFTGNSTLHGFSGTAACEPFQWSLSTSSTGAALIQGASIRVPVASLDTGNSKRDAKMSTMFSAGEFPFISGTFDAFDPRELLERLRAGTPVASPLPFNLTIRTVTRPVSAVFHDLRERPGELSLVAEFPVSVSAFRLEPPSVLGLIRVKDEVRVKVTVTIHHPRWATSSSGPRD